MMYHILNGDALKHKFPAALYGKQIVIREVMMDGPLSERIDEHFWAAREEYIEATFGPPTTSYTEYARTEIEQLNEIRSGDTVYLWFEDDLFCQANMWFSVFFTGHENEIDFYRVWPPDDPVHWYGFGPLDQDKLKDCFDKATPIAGEDVQLMRKLWRAFANNNEEALEALSKTTHQAIRYLPEVIQAHLDRKSVYGKENRPQQILRNITDEGITAFPEIFSRFSAEAGIYGYGDLQIRNMLDQME